MNRVAANLPAPQLTLRQYLKAELLDEMQVHLIPIPLADGTRLGVEVKSGVKPKQQSTLISSGHYRS
jgi:hypothetical protein